MKKLILFLIFSIGTGAINTSAQTTVTTFQGETLLKDGGAFQQDIGEIMIQPRLNDQTIGMVTYFYDSIDKYNFTVLSDKGLKTKTTTWKHISGGDTRGFIDHISYTNYNSVIYGELYVDHPNFVKALYTYTPNGGLKDSLKFYNSNAAKLASSSTRIYITIAIQDDGVVGGTGTYGNSGTSIIPFRSSGPLAFQYSLLAINHNGFTIESPIYLEKAGYTTRTLDLIPVNGDGVVLLKSLYAPNVGGSNDTLNEYVFVHFNENLVQTDTLALQYADLDDEPVMYYDTLSSTYYLAIRKITGDAIIYRLDSNWNTIDSANLGSQYISKMDVLGEQLILDGKTWMSKSLKGGWEYRSAGYGAYYFPFSDTQIFVFGTQTKPRTTERIIGDDTLHIGFSGTYFVNWYIEEYSLDFIIGDQIIDVVDNTYLDINNQQVFDSSVRAVTFLLPYGIDLSTFVVTSELIDFDGIVEILGKRVDTVGNVIWKVQCTNPPNYRIQYDVYLSHACATANPPLTASRQDQQLLTNLVADSLVWYFNNTPIAGSDTSVWSTSQAGWYFAQSYGADGTARCVSDSIYFEPCLSLDVSIINNGGTLSLDTTGEAYQWYDANNKQITGAYKSTYTPETVGQYKSRIYHDTGCYTETSFYELTSTVSVADYVQDNYTPYPNPTTNQLHIPRGEMYMSITLTNTIGSVLHESDGSPIISTKHLPAGSYTLKCVSTGGERTYKIMIVR